MRTILVIILTKFGQTRIRRLGSLAFVVRRKKKLAVKLWSKTTKSSASVLAVELDPR